MRRIGKLSRRLSLRLAVVPLVLAAGAARLPAQEAPPGFQEAYALSDDRGAVLDQLVPGSVEWTFYRTLHLQQTGELPAAAALLADWVNQHGRDEWVVQLENRQALLGFERDPKGTFSFLRDRLNVRFDDRRELPGDSPDLPSRLDPAALAPASLLARALARQPRTLDGLTDDGLATLDARTLSPELVTALLKRLQRPDFPGLPGLVMGDLQRRHESFGSLPIHRMLLLEQLQECARLLPALKDNPAFVDTWVARLAPGSDLDWEQDDAERLAYLERLAGFTASLAPVHNSLKAHVLYQRLQYDHEHGVHDRERLLAYLRLPRNAPLRSPDFTGRHASGEIVDGDRGFTTGLPAIGDETPLLRACLLELFRDATSYDDFLPVLREDELRRLFAEAHLLYATGASDADVARWYAMLGSPADVEALRSRVEVEFAPTNPQRFGAEQEVALDVDLKRVDALLVRVFQIDAANVYERTFREIDSSIELDGLVANEETLHTYAENPLRRVRRHFVFPALSQPGVYVVEFVAGGRATRAVIHKGQLHAVERLGSAGHVFRVLDDAGRPLKDASLWMGEHLYAADADGEIAVPFSTSPGRRNIVLLHGGQASLASFTHRAELWTLELGASVDREALLAHRTAKLLLRPALRVDDRDAALSLLADPVLAITAVDHDGVASTQLVRDLTFSAAGELVHEIAVPERLSSLSVRLSGHVANLSTGKDDQLSAEPPAFRLSAIAGTSEIASALLGRTPDGYVLDVLGLTGEPLAGRSVSLHLQHRDFTEPVDVVLATDAAGRVQLGPLPGISAVRVVGFSGDFDLWALQPARRTWPALACGTAGGTLALPAPDGLSSVDRSQLSLLELRGNDFLTDRLDHVTLRGGFLELSGLPAGSYDLLLRESGQRIRVELTAGASIGGWIVGRDRRLPEAGAALLAITEVTVTDEELAIHLANAGPDARVHVVASRYLPAFDAFERLQPGAPWSDGVQMLDHASPVQIASSTISDEQRYVLDRRQARKYPGNMLQRPTLLLNPWEIDASDSESVSGAEGFRGTGSGKHGRAVGAGGRGGASSAGSPNPGQYADLQFLPAPSVTLANLRPDKDGVVRVPRKDLLPGQLVRVLAVDRESTVEVTRVLPETPLVPRDLSLPHAFDGSRHLGERRRIEFLATGASATIEDVTTARAETLDSLDDVFRLFSALSGDGNLQRFQYLLRWPELTREERLAKLSEDGCHELHLFVHEHDPQLFAEVLRPYLQNKLHKTFLDRWLLDEDLSRYLDPWEFSRLNVVERALLARRLPEAVAPAARGLSEVLELRAPDPVAERRRFEAALRGADLDTAAGSLAGDLREASGRVMQPDGTVLMREARDASGVAPASAPVADNLESEIVSADESLQSRSDDGARKARGEKDAERDVLRRASERTLWRAPERTRELVEDDYWHVRAAQADGDLIPASAFWLDFARAGDGAPFVSTHVAEAAGRVNEMLLALAVLDLPFRAEPSPRSVDGARLVLRAGGPLLLVRRQIEDATAASGPSAVFVGQNLFRHDDRTRLLDGEQREVFVSDEFLTGVVYGTQVVITNPTSAPQSLQALVQVPQGAVPVGGALATRGLDVRLQPYATTTLEVRFYFPRPGDFPHYPVHVARDGELLAFAAPAVRHVVVVPSAIDTASWEHVSQQGSEEQVFAYLEHANLKSTPLARLAWRLHDAGFFRKLVDWLGRHETFSPEVWRYALLLEDAAATREYLAHEARFVARCGPALRSPLLDIDPIERHLYEHIEFDPLVNARAHRFGERRELPDASLELQVGRLMQVLAYEPRLDDVDWLSVAYHMLLQDRVEDALAAFGRVHPEALPGRLQYDLMQACLDFFGTDHARARAIATGYRDHPVPRWRARFREVLDQLDEAEGRGTGGDGNALVATEASLELELKDGAVVVTHANLPGCELRWFPMDAELLFSRDPFGTQDTSLFATIRPARSDALVFEPGTPGAPGAHGGDGAAGGGSAGPAGAPAATTVEVPAELRGSNVLVEVRGGGLVRRVARYAATLAVQMIETRGQLKVTRQGSGELLPSVYVKVFARDAQGNVRFHKDGYTDLRGRFDYASVSAGADSPPAQFSILVQSETDGTVIRQAAPPAQ